MCMLIEVLVLVLYIELYSFRAIKECPSSDIRWPRFLEKSLKE